jgi:glycosyltransferase involved in cell wall biosynthesis
MVAYAQQQQPLVSCIVIFLNEEKYLQEAIESVVSQSYGNWELLLVDDGSSDNSGSIARGYCAGDRRVRYLTHEGGANRGMSASRNLGLHHARGSLITFLDGDDSWLRDKLERQVALFKQHSDAVMVCGATVYWESWRADAEQADRIVQVGESERLDGGSNLLLEQDRLFQPGELMKVLYPLGAGATPSSSGNMFKRDIALAVGGFEETFQGLFEDQAFRAKLYLSGPIYVSGEVFDRYRQHDESCCHVMRRTNQNHQLQRRYLNWLKHYLKKVEHRDPVIRLKLSRALLRLKWPRTCQQLRHLRTRLKRFVSRRMQGV